MAKPLVLWQSHHHLIMLLPPRDYLKFQIRKDISSALFIKILKKKTPQFFQTKTIYKNKTISEKRLVHTVRNLHFLSKNSTL